MTPSAARCGAATANSRQTPTEARLAAATVADGPGFGAGAIAGRNYPRHCLWALAGDDQETDDAAGTCDVS